MITEEKREEYQRRIDLVASLEELEALLEDLKKEKDPEGTHDLAEEAVMVAGARGLPV